MVVTEVNQRAGIVRCRVLTEGRSKGAVEEFAPFTFVYEDEFEPEVKFERHQFPFRVCYAMTISKSQSQTIPRMGLNLKKDVFLHGQLYVALSRAQTMNGVRIYQPLYKGVMRKKPEDPAGYTRVTNIVYKEILDE
uniref:Uncharacterized protein n=1 Tax=Acrobeloides nanus TaxID=290746 RepID=A0A914EIW1_9BILA